MILPIDLRKDKLRFIETIFLRVTTSRKRKYILSHLLRWVRNNNGLYDSYLCSQDCFNSYIMCTHQGGVSGIPVFCVLSSPFLTKCLNLRLESGFFLAVLLLAHNASISGCTSRKRVENQLTRIPQCLSISLTRERYGFKHSRLEEGKKLLIPRCVSRLLCKRMVTEASKCLCVITSNFVDN